MSVKKYISLSKLETFLNNLKNTFALLIHEHTIKDISDYVVDSTLSSTSINPVQNKVLDAEFEEVASSMNALEQIVDTKADASVLSNYYIKEEADIYIDNAVAQKTQVQIIIWEADE